MDQNFYKNLTFNTNHKQINWRRGFKDSSVFNIGDKILAKI